MFPAKKILCPTDFSEPARLALEGGIELAEKFSAELVLVHVIMPPVVPGGAVAVSGIAAEGFRTPLILKDLEQNAREGMRKLVEERIPVHLACRSHLRFGRPADEIVRLAEEERVDLIVMATHGQTGWERIFFGSVAEKVVRLADCPVLTVRRPRQKS